MGMGKRLIEVNGIVQDLRSLKSMGDGQHDYAIEQNIIFFEAIKNPISYLKWLFWQAPKINGHELQEINDLLPKYDLFMHTKLIEMEKKRFPGLVEPIVDRLTNLINQELRTVTLINLGSGGMEVERQVINRLIKMGHDYPVVFVGVDQSSETRLLARNNLASFERKILITEKDDLSQIDLDKIKSKDQNNQYKVVLCGNDIFRLPDNFKKKYFDFGLHSLFRHHLNEKQKNRLDEVLQSIADTTLEYDGFKDWFGILPQTIIGWKHPVFLNAEIFSNLRFSTKFKIKQEVEKRGWRSVKLNFSKIGYYLLQCYH
ncbi:MAG: hypothetical protein AAB364_01315 [Patescibacteria group bacterium]